MGVAPYGVVPLDEDILGGPLRAGGFRTWTSSNAKFSTEAKIVSYASGTVTLENREGKRVKVPQDELSQADQEYIGQWRRERR